MSKIDEEILSGLTDEERAALDEPDGAGALTLEDSLAGKGPAADDDAGGDDNGSETEAESAAAGNDGAQAAQDNDDGAAAAGAESEGAEAAAAGDGAAGDAGAGEAADDAAAAAYDAPAPILVAEMPENAEARMKEFGEKKTSLLEQHENGDITTKEYQTQLDALNKEERALEREIDKATTAQELHQQQQINHWMGQVKHFTTKIHDEYAKSKARYQALDMFVREVGSDPANANLSGPQILEKAHAKVIADLGEAPKAKTTTTTAAAAAAKTGATTDPKAKAKELNAAGRPLKGSKAEPPKTLRDAPAAAANDTGDSGKWAALDRLQETDPEAHENMVMRMSADERDQYLASRP